MPRREHEPGALPGEAFDPAFNYRDPEVPHLCSTPFEQRLPGDGFGKAQIVLDLGLPFRHAFAEVEEQNSTAAPTQIHRRRQPSGAAPHDHRIPKLYTA
jgi:hypothetical protein